MDMHIKRWAFAAVSPHKRSLNRYRSWTGQRARHPFYGSLRAKLRHTGQDIGLNDTMIAAHAIALNAILVTNNTRHLSRIGPPLRVENWLE